MPDMDSVADALEELHQISAAHDDSGTMKAMDYFVVTFTETADEAAGVAGHVSRQRMHAEEGEEFSDLQERVWDACASAIKNGIDAVAERVGVYKESSIR